MPHNSPEHNYIIERPPAPAPLKANKMAAKKLRPISLDELRETAKRAITANKLYSIGVTGYSAMRFNEELAKRLINTAITKAIGDRPFNSVELVSGYTDLGIPGLAYRWAKEHGIYTVGIACERAHDSDNKVFPVDEYHLYGQNWGDESDEFLKRIDALVRIGGGEQAHAETAEAKTLGKPIFEFDLEGKPLDKSQKFDPAFKAALSQVNGNKNGSAIIRALELLRSKVSTAAEQETVDAATTEYNDLNSQLDSGTEELRNLSEALDGDLDKLISDISLSIVSFPSAHEAVNFYDIAWFQSLAKSIDAKISIAKALSNYVAKYKAVPSSLWTKMINGDPDTLVNVAYAGDWINRDNVGTNT
jgi:hypothetical protein